MSFSIVNLAMASWASASLALAMRYPSLFSSHIRGKAPLHVPTSIVSACRSSVYRLEKGVSVVAQRFGIQSRARGKAVSHHICRLDLRCTSKQDAISFPELLSSRYDLIVESSGGLPTLQLLPRSGRGALWLNVAHGDVRGWESLGLVARRQSDSMMRFATKRWWQLEDVECKRSGPLLVVARS